jgi:hypothetical protein
VESAAAATDWQVRNRGTGQAGSDEPPQEIVMNNRIIMSPRINVFVVVTTLSVVASGVALAAIHYAGLPATTDAALFKFLTDTGLLAALLAVRPLRRGVVKFDRAADFSRLSLEINVAKPSLMRWGVILSGLGLFGAGVEQLIGLLA